MTRESARLSALAFLVWLLCFAVLARSGTWLPFAAAGVLLATVMIRARAVPLDLLRPSLPKVAAGVLAGVLMVGFTHLAYLLVSAAVPSVRPATRALFSVLNVAGFSAAERAALIVTIASCEEVLFRGPLLAPMARRTERWALRVTPRELTSVLAFALGYALTTLPLQSPLLVICAFACGSVWSLLGIRAGSLTVPILCHVIWDLGVLLLWPLSTQP